MSSALGCSVSLKSSWGFDPNGHICQLIVEFYTQFCKLALIFKAYHWSPEKTSKYPAFTRENQGFHALFHALF